MGEIVIGAALSHSPLMNFDIPSDARDQVLAYRNAARRIGVEVRKARPDTLVVLAQDHFRTVFYNNMPAFLMGVGNVERWGDWNGSAGALATDPALARHVARRFPELSFEPSISYDMKVDHGISQVLELLELTDMPVIPILINAAAPPLPTPARCHSFGDALRHAIAGFPQGRRVAVIGSGGLSHSPLKVSIDHESNPQIRDFFIYGRSSSVAFTESERVKNLLARVGQLADAINPEWDRSVLRRMEMGQARDLAQELDTESIETSGGRGGQEIRAWLAMLGAVQASSIHTEFYEPIRCLVTGMGAIVARCAA